MGMQSMELPAQMSRLEDLMALKTDAEEKTLFHSCGW
jgi:hypothetical protein